MIRARDEKDNLEASALGAEAAGPRSLTSFMAQHDLGSGVSLASEGGSSSTSALLPEDGRRYDEGSLIARGGMGEVLRTRDRSIRRAVAMKVMLDPETATRQQLLRFIEEAQVTGQLEHPGIVPVHDLGLDEHDNVFYTMKLVHGTTLREILARLADHDPDALARYPLSVLLSIFQRVSEAVAFAHSKGVIHRDLKPENIMVGDFGEVLVLDWGLAKVLLTGEEQGSRGWDEDAAIDSARVDADSEGHAVRTLDGQILGTPAFMSPEQAAGRIGTLDARADIYSLGAILYTILTLRPPVQGRSVAEILAKVSTGDIVPPATVGGAGERSRSSVTPAGAPGERAKAITTNLFPHCHGGRIPAALSAVAMKALAFDPAARYASVAELQAEIAAHQTGFATSAEQAGLRRQLLLLLQRHRTFALASLAVVLALAVGLGIALLQWRSADRARLAETQQRRDAESARDDAETARQAQAALSRQAAPEFVAKAEMALYHDDLAQATTTAEFARVLDPESGTVHLLAARLLLAEGRVAEAVAPLQEAVRFARGELRARAEALLGAVQAIAARGTAADATALQSLAAVLDQGGDPFVAARLLQQAAPDSNRMELTLKGAVEAMKRLNPQAAGATYEVAAYGTIGNLAIRSATPVLDVDLTPFTGVPLSTVLLNGVSPRSMAPLHGAQLLELRVAGARSLDLAPLSGMPLETLVIDACGLRDLAPLSQMLALHTLSLVGCSELASIEPLRGLRLVSLELGYLPGISDLRPLAGMPLTTLNVYGCGTIPDLTPLQGMRLSTLRITGVVSADLAVLRDMPLAWLELRNASASNWSALRGRPLNGLVLEGLACDDIGFITGMPLDYLRLHALGGLKDLRPLAGLPLRLLSLADCPDIADFTPLLELPHLERALLPWGRTIEPLRRHPTLRYAGRSAIYLRPEGSGQPVAEFWQEWTTAFGASAVDLAALPKEDLGTVWLAEIRAALEHDNPEAVPVQANWSAAAELRLDLSNNPKLSNLAALAGLPLRSLSLNRTAVRDLTPLRGMPLQGLDLTNTPVTDLSPLANCPLGGLTLTDSSVTDLSPLRGMPLTTLHCNRTQVSDLGPLRGMNLTLLDVTDSRVSDLGPLAEVSVRTLNASACRIADVTPLASVPCLRVLMIGVGVASYDLAPLAACRHLVVAGFPGGIADYTPLRQLPWLAYINLRPADLFWFEVDHKPKTAPAPPP